MFRSVAAANIANAAKRKADAGSFPFLSLHLDSIVVVPAGIHTDFSYYDE
jgi:hypothetical protein